MLTRLLFLLLLLSSAPADAIAISSVPGVCAPGSAASHCFGQDQDWPCPTCNGRGHAKIMCRLCAGSGDLSCPFCGGAAPGPPPVGAFHSLQFLRGEVERLSALSEADKGKGRALKAGYLPCHASCKEGRSERAGREDKCLVCTGKGRVGCKDCGQRGHYKCPLCKGRGQHSSTCIDCAGTGVLSDPSHVRLVDLGTCGWCAGETHRHCKACDDRRERERPCWTCFTTGSISCSTCAGHVRAPCYGCKATGKVLTKEGKSAQTERCSICKGRGTLLCPDCKQGKLECQDCKGAGAGRLPCDLCDEDKSSECAGCSSGWPRYWIVSGEGLAKTGQDRQAAAFLEFAIGEIDVRAGLLEDLRKLGADWAERRLMVHRRERDRLRALADRLLTSTDKH